jgi:hypothetical protein
MAVQLHFQMRQEMYVLRVAVRKVGGFVISRTSCFYNYTVPKTLPPYLHKWVCKVKGKRVIFIPFPTMRYVVIPIPIHVCSEGSHLHKHY